MIDEARRVPQLRAMQEQVMQSRRQRAAAANKLLIEDHNWTQHLDGLAGKQRERWIAYMNRLAHDAAATFDDPKEAA